MESQLQGSGKIGLRPRPESGKMPLLILRLPGKIDLRTKPALAAHRKIVQVSATGEILVHFLVPVSKLKAGSRGERILRPRLSAEGLASNPAANQIAIIG